MLVCFIVSCLLLIVYGLLFIMYCLVFIIYCLLFRVARIAVGIPLGRAFVAARPPLSIQLRPPSSFNSKRELRGHRA